MTGFVIATRPKRRGQLAERRRFLIGRQTQAPLRKLKGLSHLSGQKMIREAMTKARREEEQPLRVEKADDGETPVEEIDRDFAVLDSLCKAEHC